MHAHKLQVTVSPDHDLAIRLPDDFPVGPAEVIVLAVVKPREPAALTAHPLEPHPVLGKIVFHEDPALPLDPADWPESEG